MSCVRVKVSGVPVTVSLLSALWLGRVGLVGVWCECEGVWCTCEGVWCTCDR